MLASLEHRRPIVNGYSGNRPPLFPRARRFPSTVSG
jgi:hypothetical protein